MESNWASRKPLYVQVRDALAERIANRTWAPTSPIPNEQELARELGVSAGTMRKALDLLEAERVVTRRQGRGTFVNDQTSHELAARFSNLRGTSGERILGTVKSLDITEASATELELQRLKLDVGDTVYRIHRTRWHLDQILMVETACVPASLFPGLREKEGQLDDVSNFAREYGILLHHAQERVSPAKASPSVASALGITPNTTVMLLDRIISTFDGHRPVEWRVAYCPMANVRYVAEIH